MNVPVSEKERNQTIIASLLTNVTARCRDLGLSVRYLEPAQSDASDPDAQNSTGANAFSRRPAAEAVVSISPEAASVKLAIQQRDNDLGSLIVTCERSDNDSTEPAAFLERIVPSLVSMVSDQLSVAELDGDIIDMADQITDAYEMLELMYALGHSMASLDEPDKFLSATCARVRETLGFGYVAVHMPPDADVGPLLAGKTHWDGSATSGADKPQLDRLLSVMAKSTSTLEAFNGPQAVVRPLRNDRGFVGMMIAGDKQRESGNVSSYDTKLIDAVVGLLSTFLTNSRLYNEQREMAMGVLESLSAAIDAKDPYTRGHAQRVAHLSHQIALSLGFDPANAERLRVAGLLHDVGKIGVSEAVLQKNGRLTSDEYDQIKQHPSVGFRILKDLKALDDILPAVLHHHERLDGRGYPSGLRGDDIPLIARIVAGADTFDAMSSTRSYRAKLPREDVLAEIRRSAGSQLDPAVVEALLALDFSEFDTMIRQHSEEDTAGDDSGSAAA